MSDRHFDKDLKSLMMEFFWLFVYTILFFMTMYTIYACMYRG